MTRPRTDLEFVRDLLDQGLSVAEAARRAGVPRSSVQTWLRQGLDRAIDSRTDTPAEGLPCDFCHYIRDLSESSYAYLLGLYLGDGCISDHGRGVYRLRIVQDSKYQNLIRECVIAMHWVLPNKVGFVKQQGCTEISSYSKHCHACFHSMGAVRNSNEQSCWSRGSAGSLYDTHIFSSEASCIRTDAAPLTGSVPAASRTSTRGTCSSTDPKTFTGSSPRRAIASALNGGEATNGRLQSRSENRSKDSTISLDRSHKCPERGSNPHALAGNGF